MKTIAIIEDDTTVRNELKAYLNNNGYHAVIPECLDHVLEFITEVHPDLILLDIQLEHQNGYDICKALRMSVKTPVIFVTSKNSAEDELDGLMAGGDDYIKKPYSLPVLMMRVRKLLDRAQEAPKQLCAYGVILDLVFGQLIYKEEAFELSKKEQQILYYLFLNHGRIVERDELVEYLWENKLFVDENILNVNLSRIRKRLEGTSLENFIQTIPRKGYRLELE